MGLYLKSITRFLCTLFYVWYLFINKNIDKLLKVLLIISFVIGMLNIYFLVNKQKLVKEYLQTINNNEKTLIFGYMSSDISEGEYKDSFLVDVQTINNKNFSKQNIKLKVYISEEFKSIEPGDSILLSGKYNDFNSYNNFGVFNYKEYMIRKNIYGRFECNSIKIIKKEDNKIICLRYKVLSFIKNKIKENITEYGVLTGIIIGDKSEISEEVINNFSQSSISHILAVSGMHVSYIIMFMNLILNKSIKKKKVADTLKILSLLFFLFVVGFSPSVFRAVFMAITIIILENLNKKSNSINGLFFSALVLLLINPLFLFDLGFELSYLATLGILLFSKFLKKNKSKNKVIKYVKECIFISFAANLLIFPVICYNLNNISFSFFISSIFIGPLISLIEICGLLFLILPSFNLNIFKIALNILLSVVINMASIISKFKFLTFTIITPNIVEISLYYFFVFIVYYYFSNATFRNKLIKVIKDNSKRSIKTIIIAILIISILISLFYIQILPRIDYEIFFIDVGQGDCTLIITKEKKKILIDGGGNEKYDIGKNVLRPYLYKKKIKKIDYIIISHLDYDHCGGIISLLEYIDCKTIILPIQFSGYSNFNLLVEKLKNEKKKTKIIFLEAGNTIRIDSATYINVLWPNRKMKIAENEINNNALTFKMYLGDVSILFTGDIEEEAERKIVDIYSKKDISSDVLKVAHHGSDSSTIQEILDKIDPKIALIGVGKDNKYNHPSDSVIHRIASSNCKIFRTDMDGEIVIKIISRSNISIDKYIKQELTKNE